MASELGQSLLDTDHAAQLDEHLVVGELIAQLPGGRAVMIGVHSRPQSPEILDQLLQQAARGWRSLSRSSRWAWPGRRALRRSISSSQRPLRTSWTALATTGMRIKIDAASPVSATCFLSTTPSMVRRGTCAALGRAVLAHLRDRKRLIATALEAGVEQGAENLLPNGDTPPNGDEGAMDRRFSTMAPQAGRPAETSTRLAV